MKKYIFIFSCLWLFTQLVSFYEPVKNAEIIQIECQDEDSSDTEKQEIVQLNPSVDAILTVFHFSSLNILIGPIKEFLITDEFPDFQFVYRTFKIQIEKILYTCIIQVNAP